MLKRRCGGQESGCHECRAACYAMHRGARRNGKEKTRWHHNRAIWFDHSEIPHKSATQRRIHTFQLGARAPSSEYRHPKSQEMVLLRVVYMRLHTLRGVQLL
jgi:hypothetical protein